MHKRLGQIALAAMSVLIVVTLALASEGGKTASHGKSQFCTTGACDSCHVKSHPKTGDSALRPCPVFHEKGTVSGTGPDKITLNNYPGGEYGKATFNHKAHASMSKMDSQNCWMCHHNQKPSEKLKKCSACHAKGLKRPNLKVPRLKAAYHQQCLDCHKTWDPAASCAKVCHAKGSGKAASSYKPVKMTENLTFETPAQKNTKVTFFHANHAKNYGKDCKDCHSNVKCVACHDKKNKPGTVAPLVAKTSSDKHYMCMNCHDTKSASKCSMCHSKTARTTFDHSTTGFALTGNHAGLACSKCHGKKIGKLDPTCTSCHTDWNSRTFDHSRFGFTLDKNHKKVACTTCHGKKFDRKMSTKCSSCHGSMKDYDHSKTGFPLKSYHAKLACSDCHGKTIGPKDPKCSSCHSSWKGFKHDSTGVKLGVVHGKFDCKHCHAKGIDKPTDCASSGCHGKEFKYPGIKPRDGGTVKSFDHNIIGVKLGDIHSGFDCKDCHGNGIGKPTDCSSSGCHEKEFTYPAKKPSN